MKPPKLYVGNIPFSATEADLQDLFETVGQVDHLTFIRELDTGRFRGFGFVIMADQAGTDAAIARLHGASFQGRSLVVNVARPKAERPGRELRR